VSHNSIDAPDAKQKSAWRGATLVIVLAILLQAFRILTVTSKDGETPFLSANDRSRWCTIAALIEDRSFIIDRFLEMRHSNGKTRTWYSIDMVRKPEADGTEHYYSSKPPVLSVLYAAVCSPLSVAFQRRLSDAPFLVGRSLLLIVNLLPLAMLWFAFAGWIRQSVDDTWSRWVLLSMVLFGTFLSTFNNTLNNHFPAAFCMIASLWSLECLLGNAVRTPLSVCSSAFKRLTRILPETVELATSPSSLNYCVLGFFAALTAVFELPALAWFCTVLGLVFLLNGFKPALLTSLGSLPVIIAFAVCNVIAYGDLQPPYAHREVLGPQVATMQADEPISSNSQPSIVELEALVAHAKLPIEAPFELRAARRLQTWELSGTNPQFRDQRTRLAIVPGKTSWSIHRWNDWYDYPKSYWLPENKRGVDLGEPSRLEYALHVLVGHHGIFSLTPFWLVSLIGSVVLLVQPTSTPRWWLASGITLVSIVCIAFYLSRPLIDRNYGGICSGFRWSFWLAPGWIWLSASGLKTLRKTVWGRSFVVIAVVISIFSATYAWSNPWQHPWPYAWLIR